MLETIDKKNDISISTTIDCNYNVGNNCSFCFLVLKSFMIIHKEVSQLGAIKDFGKSYNEQ